MHFLRKKWALAVIICCFLSFMVPIVHKSLPIMRERECHCEFFPEKTFQARLKKPAAPWMLEQLQKDLGENQITSTSVKKTYDHILKKLGFVQEIYHFRILDNKLYKFVPKGAPFSDTDTLTEKALKTLLMYAKVPDCDFILCGVDGVPERYLPSDYYLVDDGDQAPVFAQAKRESVAPKYVVLIPDQLSLSEAWYRTIDEVTKATQEIPWKEKAPVAIWRGGLSDTGVPTDGRFAPNYATTPRFALCMLALDHREEIDAGFTNLDCKEIEALTRGLGLTKGSLSKQEHLKGKYLPVLDGHMCTYPGYQWRLISNSVCFKQESDQVQWFYKALKPYEHFIPIKNDMSDLAEKIHWAKEHDEEVCQIAKAAMSFAKENLLFEDVYFYLHLAFVEYAKRQAIDFSKLKKETRADPRWKCIQYRKRLALKKSLSKFRIF